MSLVNLRLLNLQDCKLLFLCKIFVKVLNLFVRVLIKTILNEKKVMLVLINNDARCFKKKKIE